MATSSRPHGRFAGDGYESTQDEAALQALMQGARSARPLAKSEEATLLSRAALGDRSSQDRLVAGAPAPLTPLAAARGEARMSRGAPGQGAPLRRRDARLHRPRGDRPR